VTNCFGSALLSTACSRKASLCLRSGLEKNSWSARWLAFGVPVENCVHPAQLDSVPPPFGTAKAAWNFEVGLRADGATELRTETRVLCADVATRRRFRAYWILIKRFSGLIRQEMLAAVRSAAESGESGSADPQ